MSAIKADADPCQRRIRPPILILAEPLIQAGLERLLEDSFQLKTSTGADTGRVDLVIWSVSAGMPAATLERELLQLRERWQPAPLLLLLPAESDLPSTWFLQLGAEGLLQQAQPEEIRAAIDTLLSGGRTHVRRCPTAETNREALGLGQWLLRSGWRRSKRKARCQRWLDLQPWA